MKYLKYVIMCLIFMSCVTSKKAHRYFDEHKQEFAKDCSDAYPVRDSIVVRDSISTDTVILPNDEWWKLDTVLVVQKGDSVRIPCPPTRLITRTISHDSIIIRENTAKVSFVEGQLKLRDNTNAVLKDSLQKTEKERDGFKHKAHKYFWWLIIFVTAVLIYGFRKPIAQFISTVIKIG